MSEDIANPRSTPQYWSGIFILGIIPVYLIVSFSIYTDGGGPENTLNPPEKVRRGIRVWRRENCMVCHQIHGLGGYSGPDLTEYVNRYDPAGKQYLKDQLRYGGTGMPKFTLSDEEVDALYAFLEYAEKTGPWPRREWPPEWWLVPPKQNDVD